MFIVEMIQEIFVIVKMLFTPLTVEVSRALDIVLFQPRERLKVFITIIALPMCAGVGFMLL